MVRSRSRDRGRGRGKGRGRGLGRGRGWGKSRGIIKGRGMASTVIQKSLLMSIIPGNVFYGGWAGNLSDTVLLATQKNERSDSIYIDN